MAPTASTSPPRSGYRRGHRLRPYPDEELGGFAVDGDRLYVGGCFAEIGGAERTGLAALDRDSGEATGFNAELDGCVYDVTVVDDLMYAAGGFSEADGEPQARLAALDDAGAPLDWRPTIQDGSSTAPAATEDWLAVGGWFERVDDRPGEGFAAFSALPGTIQGTVTEAGTNEPVEGAEVTADGPDTAATQTTGDGSFALEGLTSGSDTLAVSADRYESAHKDVTVKRGATVTVSFELNHQVGPVEAGVFRVAGANRFAFEAGVDVVYVATGLDFADALTGGVAAGTDDAPVLLVTSDTVPGDTARELERPDPARVVILGGEAAIGVGVEDELATFTDGSVDRLAGPERFSTAAEVSRATFDEAGTVYIGTGLDFPDGLAGAPAAVQAGGPLLLATSDALPAPRSPSWSDSLRSAS